MLNFQDGEILEESRSREIRANTPKWESGPDTTRSKAVTFRDKWRDFFSAICRSASVWRP
jgi:hypothetical protein